MIGGVNQYYPTPPEAVLPLLQWLRKEAVPLGDVVDPAAGMGALPLWLAPLGAHWTVFDIDGRFRSTLERQAGVGTVSIEDSLARLWPPHSHVVANPPYGRELVRFVHRIEEHCRQWHTIGAVLTRITWWGEGNRGRTYKPDVLLWIEGRLSFTADGHSDTSSHCWAIWLPEPSNTTQIEWVPRGKPTVEQQKEHRAMLGIPDHQIDLFKGDRQ
tara:strand:- start:5768 stop:6409 length:642 start_codon:yes stop_codon:yes gene_type:complete